MIGSWIHQDKVNQATCVHASVLSRFSRVQLFVTLWTIACQAPLSMGFSRQDYWSRLACPLPGNLPNPGIYPGLLCLLPWQVGSLPMCNIILILSFICVHFVSLLHYCHIPGTLFLGKLSDVQMPWLYIIFTWSNPTLSWGWSWVPSLQMHKYKC